MIDPVTVIGFERRGKCFQLWCPAGSLTEQDEQVAVPRALMTTRACW